MLSRLREAVDRDPGPINSPANEARRSGHARVEDAKLRKDGFEQRFPRQSAS